MNFGGFLKRGDKLDKAFEDLQSEMIDALQADIEALEGETEIADVKLLPTDSEVSSETRDANGENGRIYLEETAEAESIKRLSTHAQKRLAELASFEDLYQGAEDQLQTIAGMLTDVITSQHLTREFLNGIHPEIHRANELEMANSALGAENRKLADQVHEATKKLQELENTLETAQRRELVLQQDKESLRIALSAAKLENIEASNSLSRIEAERGELAKALASRTVEAEKRLRENEILREKHVNLSIDLDKAHKREAEARRKFEEISAIHGSETARYTEALASLAKSEKEVYRLQKSFETAQAKHAEMAETMRTLEADGDAEAKRNLAETRGLRAEIQNLHSRLESATGDLADANDELAQIRQMLVDTQSDKQILEKQLSALRNELDDDKRHLSVANINLSELSLQQASGLIELDKHKHESEELRAEIAELAAEIKKLAPYERLYRAEKAKRRTSARPSPVAESNGTAKAQRAKAANSAPANARNGNLNAASGNSPVKIGA